MKKITLLTTAIVIAACGAAQAVEAPSLGDRIKQNWEMKNDDTYAARQAARNQYDPAGVAEDKAQARQDNTVPHHKGRHHHLTAEQKAKWDAMTPEQKAQAKADRKAKWDSMTPEQKAQAKANHKAKWDSMTPEQKAKARADRKAKWDAMTPEQKAAAKARHAKKAATTATTTTTTTPATTK